MRSKDGGIKGTITNFIDFFNLDTVSFKHCLMPSRSNKSSDLGYTSDNNPVADIDNYYLSDQGWARRQFTNNDKTEYYDVVEVAGDVESSDNPDPFMDSSPSFEFGDGIQS